MIFLLLLLLALSMCYGPKCMFVSSGFSHKLHIHPTPYRTFPLRYLTGISADFGTIKESMPLRTNNHEKVFNVTNNQVVPNKKQNTFFPSHNYYQLCFHEYLCACLQCTCACNSVGNYGIIGLVEVQLETKPNFSKLFIYIYSQLCFNLLFLTSLWLLPVIFVFISLLCVVL